jgi:hypothetical protein
MVNITLKKQEWFVLNLLYKVEIFQVLPKVTILLDLRKPKELTMAMLSKVHEVFTQLIILLLEGLFCAAP